MHRNDLIPRGGVAVTASDATQLNLVGLYVGGAGDVAIRGVDGNTVTFPGVPAGTTLVVGVAQVRATGTTATNLVGLVA